MMMTANPDLFEVDFLDFMKVVEMGAAKYEPKGWLDSDGKGTSHEQMHNSMFHHLARSYAGDRIDDESNLDHLLHLATRALMMYTRIKRDIYHTTDKPRVDVLHLSRQQNELSTNTFLKSEKRQAEIDATLNNDTLDDVRVFKISGKSSDFDWGDIW